MTPEEEKSKSKYPEETPKETKHDRMPEEEYEPEYYEPASSETQATANIIGWIIAFVLLGLAIWLLVIALR